jgi:hypothetical protein
MLFAQLQQRLLIGQQWRHEFCLQHATESLTTPGAQAQRHLFQQDHARHHWLTRKMTGQGGMSRLDA